MKKMFFVLVLVGLSFACFADKIYPTVSGKEVLTLMQEQGYSVSLDDDSDIVWMRDGVKQLVQFKDGTQQNKFVIVRCSFSVNESDVAAKLEKCNDYNTNYNQGTAYVNKKSNSVCIACLAVLQKRVLLTFLMIAKFIFQHGKKKSFKVSETRDTRSSCAGFRATLWLTPRLAAAF